MSIGKKIIVSFGIILLLIVGIFGMSWYGLQNVESEANNIVNDAIPLSNAANAILTALVNQETGVRGYLVTGDEEFLEPYYLGQENIEKNLEIIESHLDGHPIMASLIEEAKPQITDVQSFFESIIQQVKQGDIEGARSNIGEGKEFFDNYRETHGLIVADTEKLTNDAWVEVKKIGSESKISMVVIFTIIAVLTVLITVYLIKVISKPVSSVSEALKQIAEGNLTIDKVQVKSKDEVGELAQSLNKMVDDLNETLIKTSESALQVASASEQLTASAEQSTYSTELLANLVQGNAEGAEGQLNKVSHVSASLKHMVENVDSINENREEMENSTKESTGYVHEGIISIEKVVERIQDIKLSFDNMTSTINALKSRSSEIGSVIDLITDISDQTNLLALNAAIEAARAGEHGKGFAVVADEVRKLAEESKKSADQITVMVADIQSETQNAVVSIDEGNAKVEEGITSTTEARQAFGKIEESMTNVSNKVTDVSGSIQDIEEIALNISEALENVKVIAENGVKSSQESSASTQEQLATMEEVSSSAQSLSFLAEELQQSISKFQIRS
ncbi:methyl-accepting chemotaxis protein [Aquibacillus koreensis]|uniref:Methyl-accepting chemotaxis protein n=1 Tax=Aquibacillus koreensis TaxID=279446 RepID=A0A9X3WLH2_9BACI|nr:methyl-accepting chemotaxis protein [Aquibacillus koreensis]MCT2538141.1 methyl-accepting chemotaxis protein [Aquibacillus koreensis]MDC3420915.1 methyl-accepting chemotaxis protein [Aquibacillus koreensis]